MRSPLGFRSLPDTRRRGRLAGGILLLLLLLTTGSFAQAVPNTQTISTTCELQAPRLQNLGDETRVQVDGCEPLQRAGAPLLPFRTVRLLLPPGSRIEAIAVEMLNEPISMQGIGRVEFGRQPVATPDSNTRPGHASEADVPDPAIYQSLQPYPARRAEVASVQKMAGYQIALVRIFPVQYRPAKGELIFTGQLRVELTLDSEPTQAAAPAPGARRQAKERVRTFVDNPAMLDAYEAGGIRSRQSSFPQFDYLLITRSNLVSAFQPLVDLKTQSGLAVKVETIEVINDTSEGRDVPEKIRNYIRQAYRNSGVVYVLLGGDVASVPCRYAYVNMGSLVANPLLPADLYYACLDGSWNSDGDSRWGEPNDGEDGGDVDLLAEVYVGRAPVDTAAEVSIFVEKSIRYETQVHANLSRVLFLAEFLGETSSGPAQGGDMFDPLAPLLSSYQVTWLDDRPFTSPQWTKAEALDALNQSPHLVLLSGHGQDDTLIGLNYPFLRSIKTPDLDLLTNSWPFLAHGVGCNVGQFDNDRFSPDAIGEELVKRHDRGAFAAVLNSRLGWYDKQDEAKYSAEFQHRFFEHLLAQAHTNLGTANQLSKHDLLGHIETSGIMTYRWCYYEITLLGDPHLAWQTLPATPSHWQLLVTSAHDGATPPVGPLTFPHRALLTCQVTNSPLAGDAGVRYVCHGWHGAGSVPASGNGSQVTFIITNDSQLDWQWTTQVWLTVNADANGMVVAANGWFDAGSVTSLGAVPAPYYHFVQWSGDVPLGQESMATLPLTMDRPRNLLANFAENRTARGTPEWWLASFGWTNQFETAAIADADSDGMAAWQEYVAGTSPTDPASVLRVSLASPLSPGAGQRLRWPSAAGRFYSVFKAAHLGGNSFIMLTNRMLATPPFNTFTDAQNGLPAGFYSIEVHLDP